MYPRPAQNSSAVQDHRSRPDQTSYSWKAKDFLGDWSAGVFAHTNDSAYAKSDYDL